MNVEYVGRHFEIDDKVREHCAGKLGKMTRFLDEPIEARVTLALEKHNHCRAEFHVVHRHGSHQAEEASPRNMVDAINLAADKLEKQARRAHKKFHDKRRRSARHGEDNGNSWPIEVVEAGSIREGSPKRVIKSTMLRIKPMSLEEAALQLDSSAHEFVVFRDAETAEVSVLYRRKDDHYGLISPGG